LSTPAKYINPQTTDALLGLIYSESTTAEYFKALISARAGI